MQILLASFPSLLYFSASLLVVPGIICQVNTSIFSGSLLEEQNPRKQFNLPDSLLTKQSFDLYLVTLMVNFW